MSIAYRSQNPGPPGRVNFGWITESWNLFMAQAGVWVVATLALIGPSLLLVGVFYAYFFLTMFPGGFPPPTPQSGAAPFPPPRINPLFTSGHVGAIVLLEIGFGLLMLLYSAFLYGGLFRMAVQQVRGLPIAYKDIFSGGRLFGRMLGAMLLLGLAAYGLELIVGLPLILLSVLRPHAWAALVVTVTLTVLVLLFLSLVLWGLLLPAFALMADGEGVINALRRSIRSMKAQWLPATGFVVVLGLLVYASEIPCGLGLLATLPMVFLVCALAYRDLAGMPNVAPPPAPVYGTLSPGVWPPPPDMGQSPPPTEGPP